MPDTGHTFPSSGAGLDDSPDFATWSNQSEIVSDNGTNASTFLSKREISARLFGSSFGFSLPEGATPVGVEVKVEAGVSGEGSFDELQLRWNNTLQGTAKTPSQSLSGTATVYTFGGSDDLWGTSLTKADVERADFGPALRFEAGFSNSGIIAVDYVTVAVFYTVSTGGGPFVQTARILPFI